MAKWYQELINMALAVDTPQKRILEHKINQHLNSNELAMMKKAQQYFQNKTDIQNKKADLDWKHNAKIELNLFRKLVRQKVGYLLSNEPTIATDNKQTTMYLHQEVFTKDMLKTIKSLGQEAIVKGVAYSMVYVNEKGQLKLFKVPSEQIIPMWSDERRTELDAFIRFYEVELWESGVLKRKQQVEYWDEDGIIYYLLDAGRLVEDSRYDGVQPHFFYFNNSEYDEEGNPSVDGLNFSQVPLIAWRYNEDESSLLQSVETLIDNLSWQSSTNADLLANLVHLIYVLRNYGGVNLAEFKQGLNKYQAIKVGDNGDVSTLKNEIHTEAMESEISRTRKALYEAGAGIDTQDENLGNASGQALKWRYTDLDLDMNDMEAEFQQSLERFMEFVREFAELNNKPTDKLETFKYIFNRDIIINETESIENTIKSAQVLDKQTAREQHPWYSNEVEGRLEKEGMRAEEEQQRADALQSRVNAIMQASLTLDQTEIVDLLADTFGLNADDIHAAMQENPVPPLDGDEDETTE